MLWPNILECGSVTKPSKHQWPTNGATRAYVDRACDRLTARVDRLVERNRELRAELVTIRKALVGILEDPSSD